MRQDNQVLVNAFADKVKDVESVFVTGFQSIPESDIVELRKQLDECLSTYKVLKNRHFLKIVEINEMGIQDELAPLLKGPSSFTIGGKDVVTVAKVIAKFSKDHENFVIKAGIVDGKVLSASDVKKLASLPSKEELIAKVVGSIAAPLTGIVGVLNANIRNIVGVLNAIKEKKEN